MEINHLTSDEIESYVNFKLTVDENEQIITHLSVCEDCLEKVDLYWSEFRDPDITINKAQVEKKLMNQIRRSNLIGNSITLGIVGFIKMINGLIEPLLSAMKKAQRKRDIKE